MVNVEHVRVLVQLLKEPRDVLLLLRVLHLHGLLRVTPPQHSNKRLVRELHLSLQVLLLEALVNGVQLLRLALDHHRLVVLVLRHVVRAKLDRQVEDALLILVLRELRVTSLKQAHSDRADVVKETRRAAHGAQVAHALREDVANLGHRSLLVVRQALHDDGAAAGTEALVRYRLQLIRVYDHTPRPVLPTLFPFSARSMFFLGMLAARAAEIAASSLMFVATR